MSCVLYANNCDKSLISYVKEFLYLILTSIKQNNPNKKYYSEL